MSETQRHTKAPQAYRSIGEAAAELGVAPHVLRFWESKFAKLRPIQRTSGHRLYRPCDMALLRTIHRLLYVEGMTIRGANRALMRGETVNHGAQPQGVQVSASLKTPDEASGEPTAMGGDAETPAPAPAAVTAHGRADLVAQLQGWSERVEQWRKVASSQDLSGPVHLG